MTDPITNHTAIIAAPEGLRSLHFIGIGGAGMSGIALVLRNRGYRVTGSDLKPSRYVSLLENAGVPVKIGHSPLNLDHPDVVVISSAIPAHNVELQEARRRGIPVVKRAQALAWLMQSGRGIAVCGTHGKTTTTSMISRALVDAGLDPTFLVGGELNDLGSNARHGNGEHVVCEADESDGSLLLLRPEVAVMTNLELDHHSHYLHVEDIQRVFEEFLSYLPPRGLLVYCGEDGRLSALARDAGCRTRSYGIDCSGGLVADYRALEVQAKHPGCSFEVWNGGHKVAEVSLVVPGRHNVLNALAAFATLTELGLAPEQIVPALNGFTGAVRRFQWKGERDGVAVVDDYAHHPTELRATLRAAREGDWSRVIAVFQPHLYSRTEYLHNEFAEALLEADVAVVTDVYGAREDPLPGVSGKLIVDSMLSLKKNKPVAYLPRLGSVVDYLRRAANPGDLVLTLGAGDVHRVGERFLDAV
jgi:UDP-N-acetylmuramate--alanine ligase